MQSATTISFSKKIGYVEKFVTITKKDTYGRMFSSLNNDDNFSPRVNVFKLVGSKPSIASRTSTEYFNLGGITVCCAVGFSFTLGFSVTVQTLFVMMELEDVLYSYPSR